MNRTLLILRIVFVLVCALAGWLVAYAIEDWDRYRPVAMSVGLFIGVLTVLVDLLLKGFSLRGLSALTFGLAVGALIAWLLGSSPLLEYGDPQVLFLARLALFVICAYLATVIALRGKDEFQLVIPYVRFVPHEVDVPLVVLDASALVDGRIVRICEARFLSAALVVPQFVVDQLHAMADSPESGRQARGRRGIRHLNELRRIDNLDLRVIDSDVAGDASGDDKLIFLAATMKAKLLTTDYNLAQLAQFQGVAWLNINALAKALHAAVEVGERVEVNLVKSGRDPGQAVGYLADGSMVVVEGGAPFVGRALEVEIGSILPSGSGKMFFARLVERA